MPRKHQKPVYLKTKPYYLIRIPWGATTGSRSCPSQYYNALHASFHSMVCDMQMESIDHSISWMMEARKQINAALRQANKPGARVPVVGQEYPYPENDQAQATTPAPTNDDHGNKQ